MERGREGGPKKLEILELEDAANLIGANNIDLGTVQALAADRIQWRHMLRRQRDVHDAGHSND